MQLIFLGTSSGAPTKTRNVSAVGVRRKDSKNWCLVDCGEGTQHQVLKTGLTLNKLDTIFISHVHGDHCYGLPGLLASASMSGRNKSLTIVGPKPIEQLINNIQELTQTYFTFELNFVDVEACVQTAANNQLQTPDFNIDVTPLSHRVPSYAYRFTERHIEAQLDTQKLKSDGIEAGPVWGQLQKGSDVSLPDGRLIKADDYLCADRKRRSIVVAGDNDSPQLLEGSCTQAEVLVHESTWTSTTKTEAAKWAQHSTAKQVAEFAESIQLKNLVLTHFSARFGDSDNAKDSIQDVQHDAQQHYSGCLYLANDLDVYELNRAGELLHSNKT